MPPKEGYGNNRTQSFLGENEMRAMITSLAACALTCLTSMSALAAPTVQVVVTDNGFQPSLIHGVMNRPLTIRITNRGTRIHEFGIPDYRIYTANLAPGETSTVSFSPWMAGDFQIVSDPSGENRPEFVGILRVTDQK
jgi:hypothetical protein